MSLVTKVYAPYTKPGDKLCYVDTRSNHPPSVLKSIPRGVAQRIATNSSSRREFEAAKGPFLKALREAHHAEDDLKEAWDYANYVDPPTIDPETNEAVQDPTTAVPSTTAVPKKKKKKGRNYTFVIVPWNSSVV